MPSVLSDEEQAVGDPYEFLSVKPESTEQEIRGAYRKLSLKWHPDKNPDNPNAAQQFHLLSLAYAILSDPAKRSFINSNREDARRKKERQAGMEKKRRGMVEALLAREEEAKRAKKDRADEKVRLQEEERIKEQGRQMMAQAKAKAEATMAEADQASQRFATATATEMEQPGRYNQSTAPSNGHESASGPGDIPSSDLTLMFQFSAPTSSDGIMDSMLGSSSSLESHLNRKYGPTSFVVLKSAPEAKKKKRGPKAIVEFKKENWMGCWACWKDHQSEAERPPPRPILPGCTAKWASGSTPSWIEWAETRSQSSKERVLHPNDPPITSQTTTRNTLDQSEPKVKFSSSTFPSSFPSGASSFPSRPAQIAAAATFTKPQKSSLQDYESSTLFKMRQMERERLEAEIRRQEELEE